MNKLSMHIHLLSKEGTIFRFWNNLFCLYYQQWLILVVFFTLLISAKREASSFSRGISIHIYKYLHTITRAHHS